MNYIKNIRRVYCLKQSDLGAFLNIERNHVSMFEIEKRRPDAKQTLYLECLVRFHDQALNTPDEKLLKALEESIQSEVYRTLINHILELEEEIEKQKEAMIILHEKHEVLKRRFLALHMIHLNIEEMPWLKEEQRDWLDMQLRVARQDLNKCKLANIHLIDICITGLYTQLDQSRLLLQR